MTLTVSVPEWVWGAAPVAGCVMAYAVTCSVVAGLRCRWRRRHAVPQDGNDELAGIFWPLYLASLPLWLLYRLAAGWRDSP